ncbi:MAG: sigma-54-dependent Fis family transcriptional regulator [Archangiaceae bacterium]|nr:sigma-54-dependent Fis family transcriptional regulator [Archangiaceae bacterium]
MRLLIVEDEVAVRAEMKRLLTRAGHEVVEAGTVRDAREANPTAFDLVISDLRLPGGLGTELISAAEGVPVLIITSYASVRSAVDAMKQGAADYLSKPFDPDELLIVVERILGDSRTKRQVAALSREAQATWAVEGMVGRSEPMQAAFDRVRKAAPTDATVLILGESGTGKELIARAVHQQSSRKPGPFVAVNCAAIPENLIESELFGYARGAFTGANTDHAGLVEAAHGGTLFLDEIGELPLQAQSRLLRTLQDGEVRRVGATQSRRADVRLVAATHRDLPKMVEAGTFRSDLYYRLKVVEVRLPALRDRGDDVIELANALVTRHAQKLGRPVPPFTPEATDALRSHHWPGNVRELENALERALILSDGVALTAELLGLDDVQRQPAPAKESAEDASLMAYFKRFVEEHQHDLSETELARRLGISRKTLWERRLKHGLPRPARG